MYGNWKTGKHMECVKVINEKKINKKVSKKLFEIGIARLKFYRFVI